MLSSNVCDRETFYAQSPCVRDAEFHTPDDEESAPNCPLGGGTSGIHALNGDGTQALVEKYANAQSALEEMKNLLVAERHRHESEILSRNCELQSLQNEITRMSLSAEQSRAQSVTDNNSTTSRAPAYLFQYGAYQPLESGKQPIREIPELPRFNGHVHAMGSLVQTVGNVVQQAKQSVNAVHKAASAGLASAVQQNVASTARSSKDVPASGAPSAQPPNDPPPGPSGPPNSGSGPPDDQGLTPKTSGGKLPAGNDGDGGGDGDDDGGGGSSGSSSSGSSNDASSGTQDPTISLAKAIKKLRTSDKNQREVPDEIKAGLLKNAFSYASW